MCINKNKELLPYYEKARLLLRYNPSTGVFSDKKGNDTGSTWNTGYKVINVRIGNKKKNLLSHRLGWFIYYGNMPNIINHKNHIKDDNRITNLEDGTQQHNMWDRIINKDNKSGYKGVSKYKKTNKWVATIKHGGKGYYLGIFTCPKEASDAYTNKSIELRGTRHRP